MHADASLAIIGELFIVVINHWIWFKESYIIRFKYHSNLQKKREKGVSSSYICRLRVQLILRLYKQYNNIFIFLFTVDMVLRLYNERI